MLISGTWIFNETLPYDDIFYRNANHDVGFVKPLSFGIEFNFRYNLSYNTETGPTEEYFTFAYYGSNGGTMSSVIAYDSRTGWVSEDMRTVEFADGADLADECYEWFIANAVPVVPVPQFNPAALMQSFFVGQAVRRMRGKQ